MFYVHIYIIYINNLLNFRKLSTIFINNKGGLRNAFLTCWNSSLRLRTLRRGTWKAEEALTYNSDHTSLRSVCLHLSETHLSSPKDLPSNPAHFSPSPFPKLLSFHLLSDIVPKYPFSYSHFIINTKQN